MSGPCMVHGYKRQPFTGRRTASSPVNHYYKRNNIDPAFANAIPAAGSINNNAEQERRFR